MQGSSEGGFLCVTTICALLLCLPLVSYSISDVASRHCPQILDCSCSCTFLCLRLDTNNKRHFQRLGSFYIGQVLDIYFPLWSECMSGTPVYVIYSRPHRLIQKVTHIYQKQSVPLRGHCLPFLYFLVLYIHILYQVILSIVSFHLSVALAGG